MTQIGYRKLKAFLLTLLLFACLALLFKVSALDRRIDSWKATLLATKGPVPSYKVRCEKLGGAHARLHDATANVMYDEVCIFGNLPGE